MSGSDKTIYRLVIVLLAAVAFVGWAWWYSERDDEPAASPASDQLQDAFERGDAAPCSDVFAPGRPTLDVIADNDTGPCTEPDGNLLLNVVVSWECPDGTTIHQIDGQGWGNSADVWQGPEVPEPYADCVMPGADAQHP